MIIDTHTHLLDYGHWPNEWWDWVASDWASKDPARHPSDIRGRIESGLVDPDASRMITRMDRAGVDSSVLLPIDWGLDYTAEAPISDVVDRTIALAEGSGGRLIAFGGIDPRRANAQRLVSDWFDRGVRGLKLYPGCGWDPASSEAMDIYALCEERKVPVLFHTGTPLPILDQERSHPQLLSAVVAAFPELVVWLGHAGAPLWWDDALELAQSAENVRLELSVWLWDDSDEQAELDLTRKMLDAIDRIGADRLLFGSDHVSGAKVRPDGFLSTIIERFQRLPLHAESLDGSITATAMDLIMGGNAARDLGLQT